MQISVITQHSFLVCICIYKPMAFSVCNRYSRATTSAWFYNLICNNAPANHISLYEDQEIIFAIKQLYKLS